MTTTGVLTGSESETTTSATTTEDEDCIVGSNGSRMRSSKKQRETAYMFLEIPFEEQKVLFDAIRTQNVRRIKEIVNDRPDSLKWRHFIHSPLGLACCLNQEEVALLLLKKIDENFRSLRNEINYQDRKGWTPLMYAALNGNVKLVTRLFAAGAKVNCRDRLKWTPLAHACYNGHVEVVQYLLEVSNADVRLVDDCNTTVLHCLAKQRDVEIFDDVTIAAEFVLQRDQSIVDSKSIHGRTALHEACKQHNPGLVSLLLNYGARVNAKDDQEQTPVFYVFHGVPSAGRRMTDCLRLLLKASDVRLNIRDSYSLTPIHLATLEGDARAVNILVEAGADFKIPDRSKRWPIHYAARDQQLGILELLLKRDNVSQVNATSWSDISTPLTELLSNCVEVNSNKKLILQCVKVLLRYGADVSIPNAFLNTPIDLAAEGNLWSVTRLLILAGAYFNAEILLGCVDRAEQNADEASNPSEAQEPFNGNRADEEESRERTISQRSEDSLAVSEDIAAIDDTSSETDDDEADEEEEEDGIISPHFRELLESPGQSDADSVGYAWCRDFLWCQPLSLANMCRIQIRRALAHRIVHVARSDTRRSTGALEVMRHRLPLPESIIDFILLRDELENTFL